MKKGRPTMFKYFEKRRQQKAAQRTDKLLRQQEAQRQAEKAARERVESQRIILGALADGKVVEEYSRELDRIFPDFKLGKTESLLYVFPGVRYLERVTRRRVEGRSAGTSVRVMKGVSVRVGASRGTPVEYEEVVERGAGDLAVSTRHVFFRGDRRSFRIHMNKVVSVGCGDDFVEVVRDRASGLPEYFVGLSVTDARFAAELIDSVTVSDWGRSGPEVVSVNDDDLSHYASASALHA